MAIGIDAARKLRRAGRDERRGVDDAVVELPALENQKRVRRLRGIMATSGRRLLITALALFVLVALLGSWLLRLDASWVVGSTDGTPPAGGYSEDLLGLPAVLDFTDGGVFGLPEPERSVALTFDDGPDPVYTDQILAVLEKHEVPATFFVIGQNVMDNTELTRRIVASGNEVGLHSWNHARMGDLAPREVVAQSDLTREVVAGATGATTFIVRPPYSGTFAYLSPAEQEAARIADEAGYTVVMSDLLPRDYDPGMAVETIVAEATPQNGESAVITLHDSGGDRSATVAAVDLLIPELKAMGYSFLTVSEYGGIVEGQIQIGISERIGGMALLTASAIVERFAAAVPGLMIVMGILLILRFILSIGLALWVYRRDNGSLTHIDRTQGVSIIVPAYNEAAGIEEALRSLLETRHQGGLEIIVVDDGSSDDTVEIVERINLPRTRLIQQANAGKAVALNTGIAAANYDIVVLLDADTVFEPTTIERLIAPFRDPKVGAVSGNPRVANDNRFVTKLQHAEYLLGCSLDRRMQTQLGIMWCVPGAVGAFRKPLLMEVGLVPTDTLAEDTDLTVAIRRRGWKVVYAPRANAYTEAPDTWRGLWKQRVRWSYGVLQVNWKMRRKQETDTGWYRVVMSVFLLLMNFLLPMIGPVIDILGLITITSVGFNDLVMVWVSLSIVQVTAIIVAAALDGVPLRAAVWGPAQIFIYRQFIFWVTLASLQQALLGRRAGWNKATRIGITRRHHEDVEVVASPEALTA